jgi:glycosyltransferase involved in cell wall biosynthesis
MTGDISVVVPLLNEAVLLPALLAGIERQTLKPRELVIVDAGSTDGSLALIDSWRVSLAREGVSCQVLNNPGGLPGANRNCGIIAAEGEWIAFIDAGIDPEANWLECLLQCARTTRTKAVWGCCQFEAESAFEKAVCALSYGCGAIIPVLPASMFHRSVFAQVGLFCDDVRAGEDRKWFLAFESIFGPRHVCWSALVHYRHFPKTMCGVARKWFIYEKHAIQAGLGNRPWILLGGFFGTLIATLLLAPAVGISLLCVYLAARGIIDPLRRSRARLWWGNSAAAVFIAPFVGLTMDFAKAGGGIIGYCNVARKLRDRKQ